MWTINEKFRNPSYNLTVGGFEYHLYRYNTPSQPETHNRWFIMGDGIACTLLVAGPDASLEDAQKDAQITIRGLFVAALQSLDSK